MKPVLKWENKGDHNEVSICGELNVRFHREIYSSISAIPSGKDLVILLDSPDSIDLYFLQVLYAWVGKAHSEGRSVRIVSNLNPTDEQLLRRTGFHYFLNIKA